MCHCWLIGSWWDNKFRTSRSGVLNWMSLLNYCQSITLLSSKSSLVNTSVLIVVVKGPVMWVAAADLSTHIKQVSTFCYKFYSIEMPPNMSDKQWRAAHMWMVQRIRQITSHVHCGGHNPLISNHLIHSQTLPHAILSGQGWVEELLESHPA